MTWRHKLVKPIYLQGKGGKQKKGPGSLMDIPQTKEEEPEVSEVEPYQETPVIMDNLLLVESYFRVMDKQASLPLETIFWSSDSKTCWIMWFRHFQNIPVFHISVMVFQLGRSQLTILYCLRSSDVLCSNALQVCVQKETMYTFMTVVALTAAATQDIWLSTSIKNTYFL